MAERRAAKTAKARVRRKSAPSFEAGVLDYLVREHFNGDSGEFAHHTQYTKQRIEDWRSGSKQRSSTWTTRSAWNRWCCACPNR